MSLGNEVEVMIDLDMNKRVLDTSVKVMYGQTFRMRNRLSLIHI